MSSDEEMSRDNEENEEEEEEESDTQEVNSTKSPNRGRGRPPKKMYKEEVDEEEDNDDDTEKSPSKDKGKSANSENENEVEDEEEEEEVDDDDDDDDYSEKVAKSPGRGRGRGLVRGVPGMAKGRGRPKNEWKRYRDVICELGKVFYQLGWVSGTGGGISIKEDRDMHLAMSNVQETKIKKADIFLLRIYGERLIIFITNRDMKQRTFENIAFCIKTVPERNAGAVIHSHSKAAVLATMQFSGPEFKVSHLEMIKGIKHGTEDRQMRYDETLVVPIIENTPFEADLEDSMANAMEKYPNTQAILVRRHGVYVWGDTWEKAKTMAECYDYLFDVAVQMSRFNIDPCKTPDNVK
ncbi:unnamed protein product, partial [Meganyctiphanes norvegica]